VLAVLAEIERRTKNEERKERQREGRK